MTQMKPIGLAGVLLGLWLGTAGAADTLESYQCEVRQVGPQSKSAVNIQLSDSATSPAFTDAWFKALPARRKEMLAVALTAMAQGFRVNAEINMRTSTVVGLFVVAP
jgi:hypothetical protein